MSTGLMTVVKNDTFRTLATDTQFKGKVKEEMLIRLLEAFVWKNHGGSWSHSARGCVRPRRLM